MARRIILDTGTIISIEGGKLDVDAVLGADDAAATNRILLTTGAKAEFNQLAGVRSEVIPIHTGSLRWSG